MTIDRNGVKHFKMWNFRPNNDLIIIRGDEFSRYLVGSLLEEVTGGANLGSTKVCTFVMRCHHRHFGHGLGVKDALVEGSCPLLFCFYPGRIVMSESKVVAGNSAVAPTDLVGFVHLIFKSDSSVNSDARTLQVAPETANQTMIMYAPYDYKANKQTTLPGTGNTAAFIISSDSTGKVSSVTISSNKIIITPDQTTTGPYSIDFYLFIWADQSVGTDTLDFTMGAYDAKTTVEVHTGANDGKHGLLSNNNYPVSVAWSKMAIS